MRPCQPSWHVMALARYETRCYSRAGGRAGRQTSKRPGCRGLGATPMSPVDRHSHASGQIMRCSCVCICKRVGVGSLQCWAPYPAAWVGGRDALEGKGPQRRLQRRLGRRLEEVAEAVGGRLLSVTNAIEAGTWRQGDSGWA